MSVRSGAHGNINLRNLYRDTLIYGLAAVLSRGLALVVLPIYTRMLSPADYGALDMITVAGTLATLIVALEVTQAVARLYGEAKSDAERRTMASTALWFAVATYGAALISAVIAARPLAELLLGPGMTVPFRIGAGFIAASGVFYLVQNQLRVELRSKDYAVVSLLYAGVTISLGVLLGYLLDFGLNGVLGAQLVAALVSALVGLRMLRPSFGLQFDPRMMREMLHFSMPLVPSGLATFLTLYANRLLLNAMINLEAVGLFGVAARIAGIITLLTIGLQSSLTPLIYAHYRDADTPPRLARLVEVFAVIALGGCLALGQFAGELLALLAEPRYAPAAGFVMALAPATLLSQAFIFFPGIAIARRMHLQLLVFAITGAVSLLANWLLIGLLGLPGAVLATLVSGALFLALWIWISQRLYPLPVRWARVGTLSLLFAGAALASLALLDAGLPAAASILLRLALLAAFAGSAVWIGLVHLADLRTMGERILGRFAARRREV